jgi:N-sulfoglucosamine sulfohydrolase
VDFAGDAFWKELQQISGDGKLSSLHQRLYFSPTRPMFELFDREADPNEFSNLIRDERHAAVERELKAALQEWMILERDYLPLPVPPPRRR